MEYFTWLAEKQIQDAMQKGEFENLGFDGEKIEYEDDSMIPEDLRMAYKILKNSGFTPPELLEKKEIVTMMDLLEQAEDEQERYRRIQKLNYMITRMNMRRSRPINLEMEQEYYRKVVERVEIRNKGKK